MPTKRRTTVVFSLRIAPQFLQKLGWYAAKRGLDKAEAARRLICDTVKDEKPPVDDDSWGIQASDAERRAWAETAARYDMTVDDFVRRVCNDSVRRAWGTAPHVKDGKFVWRNPEQPAETP